MPPTTGSEETAESDNSNKDGTDEIKANGQPATGGEE